MKVKARIRWLKGLRKGTEADYLGTARRLHVWTKQRKLEVIGEPEPVGGPAKKVKTKRAKKPPKNKKMDAPPVEK